MQTTNKMELFNIIIIVYNFIRVLSDRANGYISYMSIAILLINLVITINALKRYGKTTSEIICLGIEIMTGLFMII